uniref:C1q domain-containing protein n=1 Tax=Neolamprologus brichardi TaxID=32507 RepID=A0A3Q4GS39_NEOBR
MKIIMFFPLLLLVCSFSAVETETAVQQPCPQDVHAVLRELTASLAVQNERITVLQRENQAKLESQKIETDKLTQQLQVKQVAFSASLLDQGSRETGPFNTQITLVFKRVVTNIGNAYNPHTGIFTAPVRGVYHFDWNLYGDGNLAAGGVLFRNGEHIFIAYEHQTSSGVSTSNGALLLLDVGDQVSVRLYTGARLNDSQNHHNTFSGHLIFTM